ncbi:MAG: ABC transporter ATP-binding protein [Deltaproteobacteria bacterium]
MNDANKPILDVKALKTQFLTDYGKITAVDDVSLVVNTGETLGVVGESGCGKTVLALSIMRLVPTPPGKIVSGEILYDGRNLLSLGDEEMRRIRGKEISMIFQEPMTSLNPVIRAGDQIAEGIKLHKGVSKIEAMNRAVEMLRLVGMPSPESIAMSYPHQMSGGMRQRVMIAMALCCDPRLMLADEPTTALDVTIQAQIIDLIDRLKKQVGSSVILITHDLGVIAEAAQIVAVMYAGQIVEYSSVSELFLNPFHPYTVGLLESTPKISGHSLPDGYLKTIPGSVPDMFRLPAGCRFQDRCVHVMDICREQAPELKKKRPGRLVRCWIYS